jgi:hypothetical protein
MLFLVLEKFRRREISPRSERENIFFALLFAFGTVYFFTAVEGTTWFAHHVVAAALLTLYMLFAVDAEKPALAGLMMGFMFLTRPHVILASLFFGLEAIRVTCNEHGDGGASRSHRSDVEARRQAGVREARGALLGSDPRAWRSRPGTTTRAGRASPTAFGHVYSRSRRRA